MNDDFKKQSEIIQPVNSQVPTTKPTIFSWALFVELGMEFAVLTALPLLIFIFLGPILRTIGLTEAGNWADHNRQTNNSYKISGIILSITLSFYIIIKKIREIERLIKNK